MSLYISAIILCMAMGGLFFSGAINSQGLPKDSGNNLIQSSSAAAIAELPSTKVNAKHKVKKAKYKHKVKAKYKIKRGFISTNAVFAVAKCSCSMLTDYAVHAKSWVNYCPRCHKGGTLAFEKTRDCPEGMVRCTSCDADFCSVHGKEHINRHPAFLTHA